MLELFYTSIVSSITPSVVSVAFNETAMSVVMGMNMAINSLSVFKPLTGIVHRKNFDFLFSQSLQLYCVWRGYPLKMRFN